LSGPVDIAVADYGYPPDASQPGTGYLLDTLDTRFRNASSQVGDNLWQVHNIYSDGRSACKYYRIKPSTNQVVQSGIFTASSTSHDFNPSIIANAEQKAFVTWSSTDPVNGLNVQQRVAVKDSSSALMSGGVSGYTSPTYLTWSDGNVARWGDVSSISLDRSTVWAVNNSVIRTGLWGTHVLAFDGNSLLSDATERSETEALKVQSKTAVPPGYSSAQWVGVFSAPAASGGAGTYFNAIAPGNYITYTVPVAKAGTYHVSVGLQTKPKKGKFQLAVNDVKQGLVQDEYSATVGYSARNLGTVTFFTAGNEAFKFSVTGRNASSTGYTLAFDYIDLVLTNRWESESLKVQSITPVPSGTPSAQWFGVFSASAASDGAGSYFNATSPGQFITYILPVAKAGAYHVKVGVQTKPNKGKFQLAINGVSQGAVQDEYNASVGYAVRDLGTVYLNSGTQAFKFTVAGKNASSTGYTLAFDYIELVP
jgi:hypothetical protein